MRDGQRHGLSSAHELRPVNDRDMRRSRLSSGGRVRPSVRLCLAALVLITLGVACATSTKDEDLEYIELACEPGSVAECPCTDGMGRGIQVCTPDGTSYGDCIECTGANTCTTYPNCGGCYFCLETCMCQDSARHPAECQRRCPQ